MSVPSRDDVRRRPVDDALEEAVALVAEGASRGVTLRITGGIAVRIACERSTRSAEHKDIDLVGRSRERSDIERLLCDFGYDPDERFNALRGHTRLLFGDPVRGRDLDVFFDRLSMCHVLEVKDRLDADRLTLSPADLLLSKLQMVEPEERDIADALELLAYAQVDPDRVVEVLAGDWRWWRTATANLETARAVAPERLAPEAAARCVARIGQLLEATEVAPKSVRWRMRARVGDRVRWYETPEEHG
jgi:hypothetical protein